MDDTSNIRMVDGRVYTVLENKEQIRTKVIEFEKQIFAEAFAQAMQQNERGNT